MSAGAKLAYSNIIFQPLPPQLLDERPRSPTLPHQPEPSTLSIYHQLPYNCKLKEAT